MRLAFLAILTLLAQAGRAASDFTASPPQSIAGFGSFQVLGGELFSPRLKAGYRFYVDPARAALFTVMRYRLRSGGSTDSQTEKFVWNERPGQRVPLRCFEWVEATSGGVWTEMHPGSPEYAGEMRTLGLVLAEQNRAYHRQVELESSQP